MTNDKKTIKQNRTDWTKTKNSRHRVQRNGKDQTVQNKQRRRQVATWTAVRPWLLVCSDSKHCSACAIRQPCDAQLDRVCVSLWTWLPSVLLLAFGVTAQNRRHSGRKIGGFVLLDLVAPLWSPCSLVLFSLFPLLVSLFALFDPFVLLLFSLFALFDPFVSFCSPCVLLASPELFTNSIASRGANHVSSFALVGYR